MSHLPMIDAGASVSGGLVIGVMYPDQYSLAVGLSAYGNVQC